MAIPRRMTVPFGLVFPAGAFLVGEVAAVGDWQNKRPDGSVPQKVDPQTGLRVWECQVIDADPEAGKSDTTVSVKFLSEVQPVPADAPMVGPFRPVEFMELQVMPWVDTANRERPRIKWSLRAAGFCQVGMSQRAGGRKADEGKAA